MDRAGTVLDNVASHQVVKRNLYRRILWCTMDVPTAAVHRRWELVQRGKKLDQVPSPQTHPSMPEQIPSCAWAWGAAYAPIRDGGSISIERGFARTPGPGGVRAPTIDVLLQIFIRKHTLEGSSMEVEAHHISGSKRFW
jgi:hypothetical protein